MSRYFHELEEFDHFTRKVCSRAISMVRGPIEMGNVAIKKEDLPRVLRGEAVPHYEIPADELMLD